MGQVWAGALLKAARWADGDRSPTPGDAEPTTIEGEGPGLPASLWAAAKTTAGVLGSPVALPTMTVAARRAVRATAERIEAFPDHLHALTRDETPPLPGDRTLRRPASRRYLITSDLHRCIPGRLDWPARQRVKDLYLAVISGYAEEGWDLIENGDVEDFWMVGGSTWGAVYDVASLTGAAVGPSRVGARRRILGEQLDRIVENNESIYRVLREGFCEPGRYHRTMGNHDDAYEDPRLVERLAEHLPGTRMADTILLEHHGSRPDHGVDGVAAVVAHGHLTDSWNGPGFAALGRAITWWITGLDDLPGIRSMDPLPDDEQLARLLGGRGRNRLISVDPRYGGNRTFDSLDEERLFSRLDSSEPEAGWPWLVFGHTHFPMLRPHDRRGRPVRYANSGCGVLEGAFSALEWDADDEDDPLRLVVWQTTPGGPRRVELVPDGPTFRVR